MGQSDTSMRPRTGGGHQAMRDIIRAVNHALGRGKSGWYMHVVRGTFGDETCWRQTSGDVYIGVSTYTHPSGQEYVWLTIKSENQTQLAAKANTPDQAVAYILAFLANRRDED